MKPQFYYLRSRTEADKLNNWRGAPVVTVCLLKNDVTGQWSRGVSICSSLDTPCKRVGRNIAKARAKKAQGLKQDLSVKPYDNRLGGPDNTVSSFWAPVLEDMNYFERELCMQVLRVLELTEEEFMNGTAEAKMGAVSPTLTDYEQKVIRMAERIRSKRSDSETTEQLELTNVVGTTAVTSESSENA